MPFTDQKQVQNDPKNTPFGKNWCFPKSLYQPKAQPLQKLVKNIALGVVVEGVSIL